MKYLIAALAVAALAGCATPAPGGGSAKDTEYTATDTPDGYVVSLAYSRYQFIPESAVVQAACRQALMASAHDEAAKRGRKIEPINEQRIRISMGRNGLTGMTSCEASVPVAWVK